MENNFTNLYVNRLLWISLITELKKRGKGKIESGAFLLGKKNTKTVLEFICFDDLDPTCLTGMIEFKAAGFNKLWKYCNEKNLAVIADVHTHPKGWTNQSQTDIENPMVCIKGHIALIIPWFAQKKAQLIKGVGVFEYLGSSKWKTHKSKNLIIR